jgi:small subunit ribosomal protein S20
MVQRNDRTGPPARRSIERYEGLANNKSAEKRIRVNERRRLRNRPYRSAARTYVKKALLAIQSGDSEAASVAVGNAISMLDRVANKGVIHKNNAARRKSRLMAKYNRMARPA